MKHLIFTLPLLIFSPLLCSHAPLGSTVAPLPPPPPLLFLSPCIISAVAMGKATPTKAKILVTGPPPLYEDNTGGPSAVVDVGAPTIWSPPPPSSSSTSTIGACGSHDSGATARWGHAVELSPSESVLCIMAGRPCGGGDAIAKPPLPLLACTSAQSMRSAKAPHLWQPVPAHVLSTEAKGGVVGEAQWPHYAPWWLTWETRPHDADRPVCAMAEGGWANGRRLSGIRTFSIDAGHNDSGSDQHPPTPDVVSAQHQRQTRSHHSVTFVKTTAYRFGGETQEGTVAAWGTLDDDAVSRVATPPTPQQQQQAPPSRPGTPSSPPPQPTPPTAHCPPPRAAHGSCCLSQRYVVVVCGRRVMWAGDGADSALSGGRGGSTSPGKAAAAKGSAARAASVNKRGAPAGKAGETSGEGGAAAGTAPAASTATLTALSDVAIFDTLLSAWVPVCVTGGSGPRGRYAAAVAAVPTSVMHQREVLVLGGLDAAGHVCNDAWLLQIVSGAEGELTDAAKEAGGGAAAASVITARWVRLSLPSAHATTAPNNASGAGAPHAPSFFARHHAAAVVSSQRIAYVVGGCGKREGDAAALPTAYTLALPHLTAATVHAEEGDGATALPAGAESAGASPAAAGGGAAAPTAKGKR